MALINDIYVFVEKESLSRAVEATEHPVEQGMDLTDYIKRKPKELSINGAIVGPSADDLVAQLSTLHESGSLISYVGSNAFSNAVILSFNTARSYKWSGGYSFDMQLKEVRVAQSPYDESKTQPVQDAGTQQPESNAEDAKVWHTVKKGDTAWDLGEKTYKPYGSSCKFITTNNPDAPKRKGDWRTLQIGTRLWVYNRK